MAIQKLYCEAGRHEWERESRRGTRPKHCDTCRNNPVLMALYQSGSSRAADVAQVTVAAQTEEDRERDRLRMEELREKIAQAERDYLEASDAANRATDTVTIDRAFDRADRLQSALIYQTAELRRLEASAA